MKNKRLLWESCAVALVLLLAVLYIYHYYGVEKRTYQLVYIPKVCDEENGFWTSLIKGAGMSAQENKMELEVTGPASEDDVESQIQLIERAIEKQPDVILVSPNDYSALNDILAEVKKQGIKLVLIDSVVQADVADAIVSTNNLAAGEMLGVYAKDMLEAGSQIGIIGHVQGSSTAIERVEGIQNGLGEETVRIREIEYCNSSFEKAYEIVGEMLEKNPQMDIIIGTNEYASVGAARYVKDHKLKDKIKVIGFDSSLEETQLLEEGVLRAIVIQKPFNMGYLGVEQAEKLLNGEKVEKNLDSGCKLITKSNIYSEDNQKLLYPFKEK